ncbi:MAG TPA: winged helix-turn-helix transcriptional regulator, partial [Candidatus Thermoplasmatota archaeon]|nr:winged helix-turn-helix transcriptional regulator [Candidatus Thermoplasmatota archaeon]
FGWLASLVPLYTRLAPGKMLDNEARARVYAHVRQHPGAHPSAIAEALDLGWGTVVYHLQRLEESKLVTCRAASHRKCYFAVGTELGAEARAAVAAMSHDKAKLIVSAVREAPGITQKDLASRIGMSQALASWHVKRLVGSGVLRSVRTGRSNALHVADHVPDLAPAAVPVAVAA